MDGGERSAIGVYTCEIGQLQAPVHAPVSGNEARVAGWGGPGPVVRVVGNDCGVVSQPAPVNFADDGAWPWPSLALDC